MFKHLSIYSDTGPETSSSFFSCLIDNGLLQARPDFEQALLQCSALFLSFLLFITSFTQSINQS